MLLPEQVLKKVPVSPYETDKNNLKIFNITDQLTLYILKLITVYI